MSTVTLWFFALSHSILQNQSPVLQSVPYDSCMVALAKRGGFSVLADIDGNPRFEKSIGNFDTEIALDMVSERLKRFRLLRNGVQIFKRWPSTWDASLRSGSGRLVTWAMNLTDDQVRAAAHFGLDFQALTEVEKSHFLRDMPIGDELGRRMQERPNDIRIGIAFSPAFEFKDPKTGKTVRNVVSDPMVQMPVKPLSQSKALPKPRTDAKNWVFTGPVLSLEGKTLQLKELLAIAEETFKTHYAFDERLADTKVFIYGQFDQERFEDSIKEIAYSEPPGKASTRDEVIARQLKLAFDGTLSILGSEQKWNFGLGELLSRRSLSADEMGSRNPSMRDRFQRLGISPDTQFRLSPALTIYLDVAGQRVALLIREKGPL